MKTIFLPGGFGFLGTNILKYIDTHLSENYRVIVFDKFGIHPAGLAFGCVARTYAGDFSDPGAISKVFAENEIDLVIHALGTTVPALGQSARYDIESNLIPTLGLVEAMLSAGVKDIVYLSSGGAVYGDRSTRAHREDEDTFPISSYGVVKLSIEKYLMQYARLQGLRPLILRVSNPYGPYHYSMRQGICNVAMASAVQGLPFKVWGDGHARKDYIYVEDFAALLFRLLDAGVHTEVVNVASGRTASVEEILLKVKGFVPEFEWTYEQASRYDVSHFELDTSKLHSLVGAYDFVSLEDGLARTYDWLSEV